MFLEEDVVLKMVLLETVLGLQLLTQIPVTGDSLLRQLSREELVRPLLFKIYQTCFDPAVVAL